MSGAATGSKPAGEAHAPRFYEKVQIVESDQGWAIRLDGKPVRTPARSRLVVPDRGLAEALAAEWAAQDKRVDPSSMPLTRLINSAIDGVAGQESAVIDDICAFAGSDLVCYRADQPEGLVAAQQTHWDPVLAWARQELDCEFHTTVGVVPREQPQQSIARLRGALERYDAFTLAAVHVMTTLTGSALLALSCVRRSLSPETAWAAAHVDEDWQISQWGEDTEARARRAARWREMQAAATVVRCLAQG